MHIPEKVGADRVQPHGARRLQAIAPVFARHAGGVDFPAADLEGLAVEQERVGADGKGVA